VNGTTQLDSTTTIGGTANFAGAINATGLATGTVASGKYLGLNSSNQVVLGSGGSGGSPTLNSITAATGSNTIDSGSNAQVWEWGTLSTQTAMSLTTSSMTGGTLLSLQDTAAAATSTGYVLSVTDATTGTGYGVYSAMTATTNTGYAGYFASASTGSGAALYATITGANNTGYAIYGLNNSTSGWGEYQAGSSPNYFAGSVGIGTASPTALLNLSGQFSGNIRGYVLRSRHQRWRLYAN
jgi:hypothetical protein